MLTATSMPITITDDMKVYSTLGKPRPAGRPRSTVVTAFGAWLEDCNRSREQVALLLKVSRPQIDKLARGAAVPKVTLMLKIHDLTGGAVSLPEWAAVAEGRAQAGRRGSKGRKP